MHNILTKPSTINLSKQTLRPRKVLVLPERRSDSFVMQDPFFNKGTAFSEREKDRLGLRGLVPPVINSIERQVQRVYMAYNA